jgi:hypothetical protein
MTVVSLRVRKKGYRKEESRSSNVYAKEELSVS